MRKLVLVGMSGTDSRTRAVIPLVLAVGATKAGEPTVITRFTNSTEMVTLLATADSTATF